MFPLRILFINVKKKKRQNKSLPKAAAQIQGSLVQWKHAVLRIIEMGRAKNCRSLASQFAETVLTEGLGGLQSRIRAKFSWASSQDFHPSLFPHLRLGGTVFTVIDNAAETPIASTFSNLADGPTVTRRRNTFRASYEERGGRRKNDSRGAATDTGCHLYCRHIWENND